MSRTTSSLGVDVDVSLLVYASNSTVPIHSNAFQFEDPFVNIYPIKLQQLVTHKDFLRSPGPASGQQGRHGARQRQWRTELQPDDILSANAVESLDTGSWNILNSISASSPFLTVSMRPELAPVAFVAAASVLLPLPSHWKAKNTATLSIIAWLFIINVIYGVDAVVWAQNVDIVIPVWCDITTKLIIGANIALPAACLCVCIHLERVASTRVASVTSLDRRRRTIFELSMCVLLPIVYMGLHFIVQGHRFDIIEDYGCRPTTYYSIPSIFLVWVPPLILSVACLVFAGLALRHFIIRRLTFAAHLAAHSALTPSRFFRLMSMAVVEMFWSLGITIYVLWFNSIAVPIRPWTSWDRVHSDWLRIDPWPTLLTPKLIQDSFYVLWWLVPASTLIFVIFFAFGADSIEMYKNCGLWIWTRVFRLSVPKKGKLELPMFRINDKEKNQGLSLPTLIKPSFAINSVDTSTPDSSTYPEPPTPKKLHDEYEKERRYNKSLSECYTHSEPDSDLDTVYSPPPPFKESKDHYDDIPMTPTSINTQSSVTYAPSTSTSPPRHGVVTDAGIPIEERIADPAELSRALGSPLYPPSTRNSQVPARVTVSRKILSLKDYAHFQPSHFKILDFDIRRHSLLHPALVEVDERITFGPAILKRRHGMHFEKAGVLFVGPETRAGIAKEMQSIGESCEAVRNMKKLSLSEVKVIAGWE
ncbi:hypothetical protein VNI00_007031 [Paramarasmius palmivorus]|uniref:Pheromone receptor n=1 Tax=Paramarasmius palmivorus TaxID=297713 RepID=A0AAW0D380_9AGAR